MVSNPLSAECICVYNNGKMVCKCVCLTDIIRRVVICDEKGSYVCRVPPRVPVNSSVNMQQILEPTNEPELLGEIEDPVDTPVSTIWQEPRKSARKSVAFNDDFVTESEQSESQNENDTD